MQFALDLPDDTGISTTVVGSARPSNVLRNIAMLGQVPAPELLVEIEEIFGRFLDRGWEDSDTVPVGAALAAAVTVASPTRSRA